MIFIVVRFTTKPEWADRWMALVRDFTAATRAEPGNLWFDWSRDVDDPTRYVLVEAFADDADDAAEAHVSSAHFQQAMQDLPQALAETPQIINTHLDGDSWSQMGELRIE